MAIYLAYMLIGAIAAVVVGYFCGAIGGLLLTFYNNNFLSNTAQGSYLWWAKFCGYLIAVFAVLLGAGAGFWIRLIKDTTK